MFNRKVFLNALFFSAVLLLAYYFLAANMAVVELHVETDKPTAFRIYYATAPSQWSQEKSAAVHLKPEQTGYSFRLTDLRNIKELRIDTSEKPATVTVQSIVLRQSGFKPLLIDSTEQFALLRPANGIARFSYTDEGFTVVPSSEDPFLVFTLPPLDRDFNAITELWRLLLLVALAFLCAAAVPRFSRRYRFLLCCALAVLTLVGVMAGVSRYNAHPDEAVHVRAAAYYKNHLLPPPIGAPETLDTYSVYGASRLHSGEIAYFFAGKFAQLLAPLQIRDYLAMRYFNVTLFAVMLILAVRWVPFRVILLPVMLSPQIWYMFSYFNSEGFGLVIALLISYQVVNRESLWNRMLDGEEIRCTACAIAALGGLLALLLLSKKNFYFYGLFLALYFIWRLWFKKTVLDRGSVFRLVSVVLIGISVFASVRFIDSYVNDFEKGRRRAEATEKYASEMYKPSTPLKDKYAYLYLKERGVKAMDLLRHNRWGEKSFRTAFGGYGYTSVSASEKYYDAVRYSSLLLLLVTTALVLVRGGLEGISLLLITTASATGLIALSFYHSWTMDFQAQGRYFLPIVGMASVFTFHARKYLANSICGLLFFTLFGISLYSFILVGLAGIPKIVQPLG